LERRRRHAAQVNVIAAVPARCGSPRQPLILVSSGRRLNLRVSSIRRLRHSPNRTTVRRRRQPQDRRVIRTGITNAGLALLKSLDRPVLTLNRRMLGHLGEGRLQSLISLLESARKKAV